MVGRLKGDVKSEASTRASFKVAVWAWQVYNIVDPNFHIYTEANSLLFTMLHLALIAALAAPMREAVYPGRAYLQQAGCKDLDKVHPFCVLLILSIIRDERVTSM